MFLLVAMTFINTMTERNVFEVLRAWLVNKGFDLEIGNVVSLYIPEHPELNGKHRIVNKSVSAGKNVKCVLGLNKELPKVRDFLNV